MRRFLSLTGLLCSIAFSGHAQPSQAVFSLTAPELSAQVPPRYTCDGQDISPELTWSGIPAKTKSLALILSDPDAPSGTFYHWVVYNIPSTVTSFPQGLQSLPSGCLAGKNSWGKAQYNGPCPPKGSTHRYVFTLYALDTTLTLAPGATATSLMHALQSHVVAEATFTTAYGH